MVTVIQWDQKPAGDSDSSNSGDGDSNDNGSGRRGREEREGFSGDG